MSYQHHTFLKLAALLCVLPLLLANGNYRFTFDNPNVGKTRAPFTLEYFSTAECGSCSEFERSDIAWLEPLIEAGELRIIYRDLPSSASPYQQRKLFCLQEYGDYLENRRSAKSDPNFAWNALPTLRGRAKARHRQCVTTESAQAVQDHNRTAFDRRGFDATPAFTLVFAANGQATRTQWTGRTNSISFIHTMDRLRSSVTEASSH